ncbi:MAG TPA: hypothetical protein PKI03_00960 [Pseudomonadota bacterium]|nr:hypothetical protein [Pseudomonadota bacterium]
MVSRTWPARLLLFAVLLGGGCDVDVCQDLSERRLSEALIALRQAGVHAEKRLQQRGGGGRGSTFALTVPRAEETRALALLAERGLPRPPEASAAPSNRLLFLPGSPRGESAQALGAALAETLERMPEVSEARVHLALPEPEPFSPTGSLRPTAAVYLRLRAPLPAKTSDIAALVAHAVPGLDAQDVSVLATESAPAPSPAPVLVHIGPFQVAADSRPALILVLATLALLTLACLGLGALAWPRRGNRRTPTAGATVGAPSGSPPGSLGGSGGLG